jgi:hypothetical protein
MSEKCMTSPNDTRHFAVILKNPAVTFPAGILFQDYTAVRGEERVAIR